VLIQQSNNLDNYNFERYVIRCGSKNRHPNEMCSEKSGLHAQNMQIILGSIVNMIGGPV
jgi:hypothetical protein